MAWKEKTKKVSGNQIIDSSITFDNLGCTIDEDNMSSNSATHIPTQQSVKAYVDANGGGGSSQWTTTGSDIYYNTGNVGIGTNDPDSALHVKNGDMRIESTFPRLYLADTNQNSDYSIINSDGSFSIYDDTNAAYRMRITSSGNVGINTTSPDAKLHVDGGDVKISSDQNTFNGDGKPTIFFSESAADEVHAAISYHGDDETGNDNFIGIGCSGATPTTQALMKDIHQMVVTTTGNVGIGATSPDYPLEVNKEGTSGTGSIGLVPDSDNGHYIRYGGSGTNNDVFRLLGVGDSERMRIDTSGNLLVGTTETDIGYTDSGAGFSVSPFGFVQIARSSAASLLYLNKLDNDGDIILFEKDGQGVGSIGNSGVNLMIGNNDTGLGFSSSVDAVFPIDTSTGNNRSSAIDLGASTAKFKDLHLSGAGYIPDVRSTSNQYLTHNDGNFLAIRNSSGAERLRIDSSGRVGIGTTSPDAKLHVQNGDIKITSDSSSGADGIASLLFAEFDDNHASYNANVAHAIIAYNGAGQLGDANYLGFGVFNQSTASEDTLAEQKLLTDLNITRDGKVGIGTTSPDEKLHVSGGHVRIESTFPRLYLTDTNNNSDYSIINNNGQFGIYDDTNATYRMVINNTTGNVGIGIDSPAQALHVAGKIRLESNFPTIEFVDTDNNPDFTISGGNGSISFYDEANSLHRLLVNSSGNVGIGASNPSAKLHTVGDDSNGTTLATSATNAKVRHENHSASSLSSFQGYTGNSWYTQIANNSGTTSYDLSLNPYGGNVGIGTNDPTSTLHVKAATADLNIQSNDGQSASLTFGDVTDASRGGIEYASTDDLIFKNNNLQTRMTIRYTGNVGIGIADPAFKLSIATPAIPTNSTYQWSLDLSRANDTARGLSFGIASAGTTTAIAAHNADVGIGHTYGVDANNLPQYYETLTVKHTDQSVGKVGIGTTDPHSLLHVDGGDVKISSDSATTNGDGIPTIFFNETTADEVGAQISYHGDDESGDANFIGIGCAGANTTTQALMKEINQMVVTAAGKVGIGTDSPFARLSILGNNIGTGVPLIRMETGGGGLLDIGTSDQSVANPTWTFETGIGEQLSFGDASNEWMRIDSAGQVGIGTNDPQALLHISAGTSGDATIIIEADTDNGNENDNPSIAFKQDGGVLESQIGHTSYGDANQNALKIANSVAAGGIEFLTGTTDGASNASSRMFIDPDGKVGIGTVTPALNLDLNGDIAVRGSVPYIFFQETDTTDLNTAIRNSSGVFNIDTVNDENTTYITRLSVDHSTGYVGVGDITPVTALHVDAGDHNVPATFHSTDLGSYINITDGSSGTYGAVIGTEADEMVFRPNAVTAMRISADGKAAIGGEVNDNVDLKVHGKTQTERLGIGGITGFYNIESYTSSAVHANFDSTSTSGSYIRFEDGNSTSTIPAAIGALGNECFIAAGGQERVRIDASGNLGVGTTDPAYKTHISYAKTTDNTIGLRVSYDVSSLDGKIISWGEGTSEGGVLGKADGFGLDASYIANGTTGLRFERTFGTSNRINPCDNTGALLDDIIDLGGSNAKFDDIYATNTSIISSSDRNLKQDIEALTEAELRVALACKGLLRKFRWISAVEEKGDDARIHFGIIAQDLQDAFTAEGLDSGRYGMFIKNTWWEHEGVHYPTAESAPEGADEITRLGVRYSELLAFIIAAI